MCVYCFQRGWMVGYSYSMQLTCQGSFPLEWPSLDHCQGPVGHGTSKLHEGENFHNRYYRYEFILAWTDILLDHSLQKPKHSSTSARSSEKQDMLALGQFWCQNLLQYTQIKKNTSEKHCEGTQEPMSSFLFERKTTALTLSLALCTSPCNFV